MYTKLFERLVTKFSIKVTDLIKYLEISKATIYNYRNLENFEDIPKDKQYKIFYLFGKETEEELALAASLHEALEAPETTLQKISRRCDARTRETLLAHQGEPLYTFIAPHCPGDSPIIPVSTDVGDASWCAPTAQVSAAAWAADTPAHTWQAVAMGKSGVAHKAMCFAAKTIALTGAKLMADPELLARVQEEFAGRIARQPYHCPIPADVQPKCD